jgi:hypothetical protein
LSDGADWNRGEWIICLRSQYYTKMDILHCPMATQRRPDGQEWGSTVHTYYTPLGGSGSKGGAEEPSYGVKHWLYNPPPGIANIL